MRHRELIARRGVPNPAPNQPYFEPCAIQFLFKSAGRRRLVTPLTQSCASTSVIFIYFFSHPLHPHSAEPRRGEERAPSHANYLRKTRREGNSWKRSFVLRLCCRWSLMRSRANSHRFDIFRIFCTALQLFSSRGTI